QHNVPFLPNDIESCSFPRPVCVCNFNGAFSCPTFMGFAVESGELVIKRYSIRLVTPVSQPPFNGKRFALQLQPICRTEIRGYNQRPSRSEILKEFIRTCLG